MFLPRSKYKGPFTATGGEQELLVKSTLKPYRGKYIVTYKGQYFSGSTPQEAKDELILKSSYEEKEKNKNNHIIESETFIEPTESDYKKSTYTRYFAKDLRSLKIIEITKPEFIRVGKLPAHSVVSLDWYLKGPAENTKYRGYMYYGAKSRNAKAVLEAEKTIDGLSNYLKDLGQFVK